MENFLYCIEAAGGASKHGFAAIKLTALGRPQFLLQVFLGSNCTVSMAVHFNNNGHSYLIFSFRKLWFHQEHFSNSWQVLEKRIIKQSLFLNLDLMNRDFLIKQAGWVWLLLGYGLPCSFFELEILGNRQ